LQTKIKEIANSRRSESPGGFLLKGGGRFQGSEAKRVLNFKEILKDETGMKLAENCNTLLLPSPKKFCRPLTKHTQLTIAKRETRPQKFSVP